MRTLLRIASRLGWAVLLTGAVLQVAIKDRFEGLSLLFYALPKPVLACIAVILLVWPTASRRSRLLAGVAAVAITGWWSTVSWGSGPPPQNTTSSATTGEEVKILFWNLNRSPGLAQEMVDLMKELQPHIGAFVEPGPRAGDLCAAYETLLPGYRAEFMPRGILWVSRVPSKYRDRGKLDGIGAFARFKVDGLGPTFPVVVADVYAQPIRSRRHQLQEILGYAEGRDDAILAGDFNTPGESVHFEAFRAQYQDVLETAGHGFRETWPLGLPLLSLDHVWVGSAWLIIEARSVRRPNSDHKAILVTLRRK